MNISALGTCLGTVAPFYNLALVLIVVALFIKLFRVPVGKTFAEPWKLLFAALVIYIIEEALTVGFTLGLVVFPRWLFPLFEMTMIILFIYMLLIQKENLKLPVNKGANKLKKKNRK